MGLSEGFTFLRETSKGVNRAQYATALMFSSQTKHRSVFVQDVPLTAFRSGNTNTSPRAVLLDIKAQAASRGLLQPFTLIVLSLPR